MFDRRTLLKAGSIAGPVLIGNAWPISSNALGFQQQGEPSAAGGMIVHTETPRNSEPPLDRLIESWITPNDRFYVRSHAPVPQVEGATFELSIEGMVDKPFRVTTRQISDQFKRHSVVATMTCAGNRRNEHSEVKQISGVPWQAGAIGNAKWDGARLSDLLRRAGVQSAAKHVWFEGVDQVKRSNGVIPFGGSIPIEKAMADSPSMPGALVAYGMNGERLPPHHGYPLRTVVPGFIGARSVKWLGKIVVSDRPSPNHYVAEAYKLVQEGTESQWDGAPPIYNFPINSVTCLPARDARVMAGRLPVEGYSLAPGVAGRTVARVELSADGGRHWLPAQFTSPAREYCWRFWKASVPVSPMTTELVVRATDSAGNMQPLQVAWNLKGYLFNAFHRTPIRVG